MDFGQLCAKQMQASFEAGSHDNEYPPPSLSEEITAIYLFAQNCELKNKTLAQNHPSWLMLGEKLLPVGLWTTLSTFITSKEHPSSVPGGTTAQTGLGWI